MSLNHIVTPLDSAVLDSKEQYVFYHKMVDFVLKELIVSVQHNQICSVQEVKMFKQYCDLFLYSIEAMRIKYMYDEEDNMKVDLTDSGFPNYLEFRYLFNDLELRENYIKKLTDVDVLKENFLDQLMRKKQLIPKRKLFQAASIVYYTSVEQKYIFNRFVQGKIVDAPKNAIAPYMTSWSFYDVSHNRPFICFMYFNYEGRDRKKTRDNIYEVLKQTADRDMDLDAMAYIIDRKVPEIMPKHIKRIDLGPLHNIFAKDENEITHAILDGISKKELPVESYAVSMEIDEVTSDSQFKDGGFFNKQVLQKWQKVHRQNYVFAPHRMIQVLYDKTPKVMNTLTKPPFQVSSLQPSKGI